MSGAATAAAAEPLTLTWRSARPRRVEWGIRLLMVATTFFGLRYFSWRVVETIDPNRPLLGWWFLAFEALGFFSAVLYYASVWRTRAYDVPAAPAGKTVDVFIATYNEPVTILRDTIVCALAIEYPHRTVVCDDGARPAVRALCEELGADYLARPDRTHAKAGNLNNALRHSTAEFVVVLDADHVPLPSLIHRLLGFFRAPEVAVVQSNQNFYNLDSFQHEMDPRGRGGWQMQELFFNVIQPAKNAHNAVFYCGSPAMLRRAALDEIGGFATESLTEDMHTSMRLQKRGWRVIYHHETLAWGLSPQTYPAYSGQWSRWGRGAAQVLRVERPLTGPGLSRWQRLSYLATYDFLWGGTTRVVFVLMPIVAILFGAFPLTADPWTYVHHFVPMLGLTICTTAAVAGSFRSPQLVERYNFIKLFEQVGNLRGLFQRRSEFKVTPKSRSSAAGWRAVRWYIVLLALLWLAAGVGLFQAWRLPYGRQFFAYLVTSCFVLYYFALGAPILAKALTQRERREFYRFPAPLDVRVQLAAYHVTATGEVGYLDAGWARNLNRFGCSITLDRPLPRGSFVNLDLDLPGRRVPVFASVRWNRRFRPPEGTRWATGLRFDLIAADDADAVAKYLFWDVAQRHGQRVTHTARSEAWAAGHARPPKPPTYAGGGRLTRALTAAEVDRLVAAAEARDAG